MHRTPPATSKAASAGYTYTFHIVFRTAEGIVMPIRTMLSSTVEDLWVDRKAVARGLEATGIVELVGVAPGNSPAVGSSPYLATVDIARTCELYVLILGGRYGFETYAGKSATEAEYLGAYKDNPTKVIVLRKRVPRIEARQKQFIRMVTDYHKGYFVNSYSTIDEAEATAKMAFEHWLVDRAAIGRELNYFDHFIRLAVQRSPFPGVHAEYQVNQSTIELTYRLPTRTKTLHFEKTHLYIDFWGSLEKLERAFEVWRSET